MNHQNSLRSGRYSLGKSTIKSHTPISSYKYYYMDVTYDRHTRQGTYSVPSFEGTLAKGIAFFVGITNVPAKLAGNILKELAWAGIVTIAGKMITMPFFDVSAIITEYTVYGEDTRDSDATGEFDGTKAVVNHDGSKHFNKTFYDGIDIRDWGEKNITYGLIQQAYPGLYMEMEVISER